MGISDKPVRPDAAGRRRRARLTQLYRGATLLAWTACPAAGLFLYAALEGAQSRSVELRQRLFDEMDREDADFCRKLGLADDTHEQTVCKMDLLELRRRHEKMLVEAMGGVL